MSSHVSIQIQKNLLNSYYLQWKKIMAKDRTTNIEYPVPVAFTVDMMGRTTEVALDESRL